MFKAIGRKNTADDYIKNKPTIPTKVSDLTNDTGIRVY